MNRLFWIKAILGGLGLLATLLGMALNFDPLLIAAAVLLAAALGVRLLQFRNPSRQS